MIRLEEMARVGIVGKLEVVIFTDDPGMIPHMHIRDAATRGRDFHCCLRLDKPAYFKHTGKEKELNVKQEKDLIEFLQSSHKTMKCSNWDYLCALWNDNNSSVSVVVGSAMPNYMEA